jgi:hypothetical protein
MKQQLTAARVTGMLTKSRQASAPISKKPNRRSGKSVVARPLTIRLVEVPMMVHRPPRMAA